LKFVLIFNHVEKSFKICLSGQNKAIRKEYWKLFKINDWNKYILAESIDNSLSIIYHPIEEKLDLENTKVLIKQIETESLKFINEINEFLKID